MKKRVQEAEPDVSVMTVSDDDNLPERPKVVRSELSLARERRNDERRAEAMSLLLAGFTHEQISDRLEVSREEVTQIIARALRDRPAQGIPEMRQIENERLNKAQAAIWPKVLAGDSRAISTFLNISGRRSRLNGLDAPLQIELSANVRIEMEQALHDLQQVVMGEVIDLTEDDYAEGD